MASKDIRYIKTLSSEIGINRQTLAAYIDSKVKRYDAEILNKICMYFQCQVGDVLKYTEDEGETFKYHVWRTAKQQEAEQPSKNKREGAEVESGTPCEDKKNKT